MPCEENVYKEWNSMLLLSPEAGISHARFAREEMLPLCTVDVSLLSSYRVTLAIHGMQCSDDHTSSHSEVSMGNDEGWRANQHQML